MNKDRPKIFRPPNLGWLDVRLNEKEMDYVWRCIKNKKERRNKYLAGNISNSYTLLDRGNWFWMNVISPLVGVYNDKFENLGNGAPTNVQHPYELYSWWVNYQKQNEFNPLHNHGGMYSFVIWMKIPEGAGYKKQNRIKISADSNYPCVSAFSFAYSNILGTCKSFEYKLEPEDEGTLVLFPSQLRHLVYPFYNCDEDRISVSGNISMNTSIRL